MSSTETKGADFFQFNQTTRIPNSGDSVKDSYMSRTVNADCDLSDFRGTQNYDPRDVVMSLGSRFYESYFGNEDMTNGVNTDLEEVDLSLSDKLCFTGYTDGHDLVDCLSFSENEENTKTVTSLGLALGERLVINPQPQFNKRDDPRTNPYRSKIGRVYAEQIMNNWPVALFSAGTVKYKLGFMKLLGIGLGGGIYESYIRTGGDGIFNLIRRTVLSIVDVLKVPFTLAKGLMGLNKIVTFRPAVMMFHKYMTGLMQMLAANMGLISDGLYVGQQWNHLQFTSTLPGQAMGKKWYDQYVGVRCSNQINVTESFSNSTRENPLMEQMNSASMDSENMDNGMATAGALSGFASSFSSSMKNGGGLINSIGAGLMGGLKGSGVLLSKLTSIAGNFNESALVMSGKSRIVLPDIWSESAFQRSFSFNFKFHSPYGDRLSIFENTYYPYLFFLTLALSRQTGKMTYTSPFYVRVGVRGMVQIDYGIVTDLTVVRGSDINDWTHDGYPKTISIDVNIKDMTPNISIPMATRGMMAGMLEAMFPTSGMSEYMATIGGLSLRDQWWVNRFRRATDLVGARWNSDWRNPHMTIFSYSQSNLYLNIYKLASAIDADTLNKDIRNSLGQDAEYFIDNEVQRENINKMDSTDTGYETERYMMTGLGHSRDVVDNYNLRKYADSQAGTNFKTSNTSK